MNLRLADFQTSEALIAHLCDKPPSDCSCDRCNSFCALMPCLGTPQDIARLKDAGHADRLASSLWLAGLHIGLPAIEMVQIKSLAAHGTGGCPFFQANQCALHNSGLKPTDGRLSNHEPTRPIRNPAVAVALTWLLPVNRELVRELRAWAEIISLPSPTLA